MKRPFLVLYDYGQGGVWAFVQAESASEIRSKFPELKLVRRPPRWMSKDDVARLERTMMFDVDKPRGFLETLLAKRADGGDGLTATRA